MNTTTDFEQKEPESKADLNRRSLWIGLGVLAVLVVAALAGFFALRGAEASNLAAGRAAVAAGDWEAAQAALDKALGTKPDFIRQSVVKTRALRGLARFQLGDHKGALADLDAALDQEPDLVDLFAYRARLHRLNGDDDLALADTEAALAQADLLPDHLLAMLHTDRAILFHNQGEPSEVMAEADAALAVNRYLSDETVADLYRTRALAAAEAGQVDQSINDALAALEDERLLSSADQAALQLHLARLYYQEGLFDQALEAGQRAIDLEVLSDEQVAEVRLLRGDALYRQGNLAAALDEVALATELESGRALHQALQALDLYRQGDGTAALTAAEAALAVDDQQAPAHFVRGAVLSWQGDLDGGLQAIDQALDLEPDHVDALAMRVYIDLHLNDLAAAETDLAQAQASNPADPAALWAEAQLAVYNYEYEQARALLDTAVDLDGNRPEFLTWRAMTYYPYGELEMKAADLDQALDLDEDFAPALFQKLDNDAQRMVFSSPEAYLAETERLAELHPDHYLTEAQLAGYYTGPGNDLASAITHADRAIELRPESTLGYVARGYVHMAQEDFDLAQADLDTALALRPGDLSVVGAQADLHAAQDEYQLAVDQMKAVQAALPASSVTLTRLAALYSGQDELDLAWEAVHQALALDPLNPGALALRSSLHIASDELDQAQVDLIRALEAYPNFALGHFIQAQVQYFEGDNEAAIDSAELALVLDPTLTDAYPFLYWIAIEEEDLDQAMAYLDGWQEGEPDAPVAHMLRGFAHNQEWQFEEAEESLSSAVALMADGDQWLDDARLELAMVHFNLADEESADRELSQILASGTDLDAIASAEVYLASPGLRAVSVGGRRVIEDPELGFTISFAEYWRQGPVDPSEGYVLSLAYGDEPLIASVDVYVMEWDPSLPVRALADYLAPSGPDIIAVQPLQNMQIGGRSGLLRTYQDEVDGRHFENHEYYVSQGAQVIVIIAWVDESEYEQFQEEFEAIAASFAFLP